MFANSALVILLFSIIKLILLCIFFPPFFPVDICCMFRYYCYCILTQQLSRAYREIKALRSTEFQVFMINNHTSMITSSRSSLTRMRCSSSIPLRWNDNRLSLSNILLWHFQSRIILFHSGRDWTKDIERKTLFWISLLSWLHKAWCGVFIAWESWISSRL